MGYEGAKYVIEVRDGRNNSYATCMMKEVLDMLTRSGADNEVLVLPKTCGKDKCINLIILD